MSGAARGGPLARAVAIAAGLALGAAGIVWARSEWLLERPHPRPLESPRLAHAVDRALLERGRHLVTIVAQCTHCHGPDLAGRELADDPWIGRLHAANLTRGKGGIGARYADRDWDAALRHGVAPGGRSLLLMPSAGLARLSDRDLAAIVAYLRQVPPVDRVWPAKRAGWLTRLVVAAGFAPDLLSADQVVADRSQPSRARATRDAADAHATGAAKVWKPIEPEPTAEYGEYLVALGGCRVCHRADLAGGLHPLSLPGEPIPPDLTPRGPLGGWTRQDFARAMQEGRTPDGRLLDREFMPWPAFAGLEDVEIDAIWRYLRGRDGQEGRDEERDHAPSETDLAQGPTVVEASARREGEGLR